MLATVLVALVTLYLTNANSAKNARYILQIRRSAALPWFMGGKAPPQVAQLSAFHTLYLAS